MDNKCERVIPSNCLSADNFNYNIKFRFSNLPYALYHNSLGFGCNKCWGGFTGVLMLSDNANPFICV